MGNKIENCKNVCCYKNIKEQNEDGKNNIFYINPIQNKLKKLQSTNINNNINCTLNKQKSEKNHPDNQKITSQSTANISKKNTNKNLKNENLNINSDDKYIDKETVINKEVLNLSINKIQRIFQNNLLEKNKNIIQSEEDFNKKMNIKRINSEMIPINKKINKKIQNSKNENSLKSINEENNVLDSKHSIISNNINSNNILNSFEDEMKISVETINIYSTFSNLIKKNITITSNNIKSSSSFYSIIDSYDISKQPKGYFLYKQKKYKFYGKKIEGKKEGFGIIKWNDGSIMKANFKNSKIEGFAQFKDTNIENSIFKGEYKENTPKGYGYYIKDNVKTEGDNWEKNHLYGIGMEIWSDDNFYQGEFNKSLKNGIGLYRWPDGTLCIGEWKNNKLNGYGLMKYSNDSLYIGEFKDSLMNGFGEFLWNDTEYYCGYYKDGNKNGFGIYVWNFDKLSCYVGFWDNGKQHGVGMKIIDFEQKFAFYKDGKKTTNLNGAWEFKDYLKGEQTKYFKFMNLNVKVLVKFIISLKNHDDFFKTDTP